MVVADQTKHNSEQSDADREEVAVCVRGLYIAPHPTSTVLYTVGVCQSHLVKWMWRKINSVLMLLRLMNQLDEPRP